MTSHHCQVKYLQQQIQGEQLPQKEFFGNPDQKL